MKRTFLPAFQAGLFFCIFCLWLTGSLYAQGDLFVFSSGGGIQKLSWNGGEVDCFWNIGEPIMEEFGSRPGFDASTKRLTQGFEQGEGFIPDQLHAQEYAGAEYKVTIYPNPVRGDLHISLADERNLAYDLTIRNLQGVCFRQRSGLRAGRHMMDFSELKDGIYLLEVASAGYVRIFKVIKVS